jgi:hypothetical protein
MKKNRQPREKTSVMLSPDARAKARRLARQRGLSISRLVENLIEKKNNFGRSG